MTQTNKSKGCKCPVCVYGDKITDLVYRTPDPTDKKLIEELYNNLIHVEDDRDFHSIKNEGCDIKHGGISFTSAVKAIDFERSKAEKKSK